MGRLINGTDGDDVLESNIRDATIIAGGGDDYIRNHRSPHVQIDAGSGNDRFTISALITHQSRRATATIRLRITPASSPQFTAATATIPLKVPASLIKLTLAAAMTLSKSAEIMAAFAAARATIRFLTSGR